MMIVITSFAALRRKLVSNSNEIYVVARVDDEGNIKAFSRASGRGASMNAVVAFVDLDTAKRSLAYREKNYYNSDNLQILVANTFRPLTEEEKNE